MWNLFQTARTYGQRPSDLLGLPVGAPVLRLDFDQAVTQVGLWVEGRVSETDKAGRPVTTLARVLADPLPPGQRAWAARPRRALAPTLAVMGLAGRVT